MYYVPLRGWDEQTAEDVYEYIDSERNPVSSVLKSAKGRKSIPDEIFATIGNMAESAIMQGNRNMMKQSFMSMVINHPTDIATLKKAWYVYDPVKDEWNISMPDIQESDNAETIAEKIKNHEEQMKQLKNEGRATQKSNGLNINYRINKNNISQHVVDIGEKELVIQHCTFAVTCIQAPFEQISTVVVLIEQLLKVRVCIEVGIATTRS